MMVTHEMVMIIGKRFILYVLRNYYLSVDVRCQPKKYFNRIKSLLYVYNKHLPGFKRNNSLFFFSLSKYSFR